MTQLVLSNSIQSYLVQINRFPLLSAEEEFALAVRFKKHNDLDAAHKLITSNLRFVVKVAFEYRYYGLKLADLIQEGNIGLMKAVKKFNPEKGYRLITYAVWWIKSHIQAFILKNWNIVNRGTDSLKKRLFYQLDKSSESLANLDKTGSDVLRHNTIEPIDAEYRDLSLDNRVNPGVGSEEEITYLDILPDTSQNHEDALADIQEQGIVKAEVSNALNVLNSKERYVIENRIMADPPLTLQEVGERLGISRERVRQIEEQALKKLKQRNNLKLLANNIY